MVLVALTNIIQHVILGHVEDMVKLYAIRISLIMAAVQMHTSQAIVDAMAIAHHQHLYIAVQAIEMLVTIQVTLLLQTHILS